jgi:hypothetical protein
MQCLERTSSLHSGLRKMLLAGLALQETGADHLRFQQTSGRRALSANVWRRESGMDIPDEQLAAYLDGELAGSERARIEQAIESDTRLARRVAQFRARRARLHGGLETLRQETTSRRALQTVRSVAATGSAQVIDLARVRAERKKRTEHTRLRLSRRVAVAGSLAVGLLLGLLVEHLLPDASLTQYRDGALFAHGALADALEEQLGSTPLLGRSVRVGLSYRGKEGHYCRTFVVREVHALSGLACREQQHWRVWTLEGAEGRSSNVRLARGTATLPPEVAQAVGERTSGKPLDAQDELSAQRSGWR